jgi:hypothetical protein
LSKIQEDQEGIKKSVSSQGTALVYHFGEIDNLKVKKDDAK